MRFEQCLCQHNFHEYSLAASIIDKAIELRYIGGVYGNQRPTEFLCLLLKLLQIQPEKEILLEYMQAEEFKSASSIHQCPTTDFIYIHRYLRALAVMYIRMTFRAVDVYELLEPLLKDYRKLRTRHMGKVEPFWSSSLTETRSGGYSLTFIDEFASELLTEDRVCDIILPRLQKRQILEENGQIGPRKSRLLSAMDDGSEDGSTKNRSRSRSPDRSRSRSPSASRSRSPSDTGSRYVSRSPSRSLSRSPSPIKSESGMDIDGGS